MFRLVSATLHCNLATTNPDFSEFIKTKIQLNGEVSVTDKTVNYINYMNFECLQATNSDVS